MDKYTIDALKAMLWKELDAAVERGIKSHQDLDIVKDAAQTIKNLMKIEKGWPQDKEWQATEPKKKGKIEVLHDLKKLMNESEDEKMKSMMMECADEMERMM